MKKLFPLVLFLLITLSVQPVSVRAENETAYLKINAEKAAFYLDDERTSLLCYLPYTYYVRLIEETQNSYHVEIGAETLPKIDGYVDKLSFINDGKTDFSSPYPFLTLTTETTAVLYDDCLLTKPVQYLFKNRSMNYYGYYIDAKGDYCYYVSYNGKLGFVKESELTPFTIAKHPNSIVTTETVPTTTEPFEQEQENSNDAFGIKIAVYVCLGLGGIIALVVAIKPVKRKKETRYYDENEYE